VSAPATPPSGPQTEPGGDAGATQTVAVRVPTVITRLRETALRMPAQVAVRAQPDGDAPPTELTYAGLWRGAAELALGLEALGLGRGERVAIVGENGPELLLADLATIACRGLSVPLYPSEPVVALRALLRHAAPRIAVVESGPVLARFLEAIRELPERPRVVAFGDRVPGPGGEIRAIASVQADGRRRLERAPAAFDDMADATRVRDEIGIQYTAGTCGAPKGALIRHECAVGWSFDSLFVPIGPGDTALVELSYANVFARLGACYRVLFAGGTVAFAPRRARLRDLIAALRPTLLFAAEGELERLAQEIVEDLAHGSRRVQRLVEWGYGLATRLAGRRGRQGKISELLLLRRIRGRLGGRLRMLYVAGRASERTLAFYRNAGLPVFHGYGTAEHLPRIAIARPDAGGVRGTKPGTAGRPAPGITVKIAEDGEILVRGGVPARSYWRRDDGEGADVTDADGWFHTGDVGRLDEDGFLIVEDRKADLIRLASGVLVAPRPIEDRLRESPLVAQAAVVGEGRPYTVALIYPEMTALRRAAEARGLAARRPAELLSDEGVRALFAEEIARRTASIPEPGRPERFRLLSIRFSEAGGELSPPPVSGLRRKPIEAKYRAQIDALYAGDGVGAVK
jgi:long-chain acyl-CoA synthetase